MKRDLRSMKKDPTLQQAEQMAQNVDPRAVNDVQSVVDRYSGKSDAELLNELKGFRQAGLMNDAALGDVAQKIAPLLNAEQQQRLFAVMQQLKQ